MIFDPREKKNVENVYKKDDNDSAFGPDYCLSERLVMGLKNTGPLKQRRNSVSQ